MNCLNCNSVTSNPKYCSVRCSAIANNKLIPKRIKKDRYCRNCNIKIDKKAAPWVCIDCNPKNIDYSVRTLEHYRVPKEHNQYYTEVRSHARYLFYGLNKNPVCFCCGYSKHVEICHIKAIKDFEITTPISVVNSIHNLIALCPNCHWEFDNKLLVL